MVKYQNSLNDEILAELEAMQDSDTVSEDYQKMVDGLTKLIDRSIELEKVENDKSAEAERLKVETEKLKLETEKLKAEAGKSKVEMIDKAIGHAINIAGIIIPVMVTIWGVKVSFAFEKEDNITTTMGRGFIGRLLPKH